LLVKFASAPNNNLLLGMRLSILEIFGFLVWVWGWRVGVFWLYLFFTVLVWVSFLFSGQLLDYLRVRAVELHIVPAISIHTSAYFFAFKTGWSDLLVFYGGFNNQKVYIWNLFKLRPFLFFKTIYFQTKIKKSRVAWKKGTFHFFPPLISNL